MSEAIDPAARRFPSVVVQTALGLICQNRRAGVAIWNSVIHL